MEKILQEKDLDAIKSLFGNFDENIKIIENQFGVSIAERNGLIKKLKVDTDYLANTQLYVKTYLDGFIIIREFELMSKQFMFK